MDQVATFFPPRDVVLFPGYHFASLLNNSHFLGGSESEFSVNY